MAAKMRHRVATWQDTAFRRAPGFSPGQCFERHSSFEQLKGRYPHGMACLADLDTLPGADLVRQGAEDLEDGHESAEALLVSIGAPRLRSVGIELSSPIPSPEHKLYLLLAREKGDAAHSAYNALLRRLVSFERAAACAS